MSVILCTAGYDHTIRFWEALSGLCSRTISHPDSQVNRLCISPEKRFLAAAGSDSVKIYDIRSTNPQHIMQFKGHTGNVTGVAFHCESKWMVTSSEDGTVKIWDIRDGKVQRNYDHKSPVNDVVIHPNQGELIACDRSGSVRIWDLGKNCCAHELQPNAGVNIQSVTVATDGSLMCAGDATGVVHIWRLEPEGVHLENTRVVPILSFQAHKQYIMRVLLSPDVRHLATCSSDHNARIWEVDVDPQRLNDPNYQQQKAASLPQDLRPEQRQAGTAAAATNTTATANTAATAATANATGGTAQTNNTLLLEANLSAHQRWVWDCAFSADSAYLVTASSDHCARLWELNASTIIRQYNGHHRGITSVALNDYSDSR